MNVENPSLSENNNERIPVKQRMALQAELLRLMRGEKPAKLSEDEEEKWHIRGIDWSDRYARTISDIIDSPEYAEIRTLIMAEHYADAAKMILPLLPAWE